MTAEIRIVCEGPKHEDQVPVVAVVNYDETDGCWHPVDHLDLLRPYTLRDVDRLNRESDRLEELTKDLEREGKHPYPERNDRLIAALFDTPSRPQLRPPVETHVGGVRRFEFTCPVPRCRSNSRPPAHKVEPVFAELAGAGVDRITLMGLRNRL